MSEQPRAFVVIEDPRRLAHWSERIMASVFKRLRPDSPLAKCRDMLTSPDYHLFHRARTLVIICAGPGAHNGEEDCCLAAHTMRLGPCPIGFARPWSNQARVKRSLSIPDGYVPVCPVVAGYPSGVPEPMPRRAPEMLPWE